MKKTTNKLVTSLIALSALSIANIAQATIVEFQTSHGNFTVNLFDQTTPKTVDNFLHYVNEGKYENVLIHRVASEGGGGTIVQGGGYENNGTYAAPHIQTIGTVDNEPVWSNVKGTISMAKGSDPDSATSEWFVNIHDNSDNGFKLDTQTGGFTVFGQIIEGMDNLEAISNLTLCGTTPMTECVESSENFVTISHTSILDDDPASASTLSPVKNTLLEESQKTPSQDNGSSGGSLAWLNIFAFGLVAFRKKFT
jgi:cyclophilin family peptidyl-prolyl cis-trans isomerase